MEQQRYHCCEWRGRLAAVDRESKLLRLFSLRQRGGQWVLHQEAEDTLESSSSSTSSDDGLQACQVVLDAKRGTKRLFISSLQRRSNGHCSCCLLVCSQSEGRLVEYGRCQSQHPTTSGIGGQGIRSISLLDGPIVVWTEGKLLQVAYTPVHTQEMAMQAHNLEGLLSDGYKLKSVDNAWSFLWPQEINSSSVENSSVIVAFLKLKVIAEASATDSESVTEWVCLQVKLHPQSLRVKLLQVSEYVPHDYGCIATCVAVHKSYGVQLSTGDVAASCKFLVGTEYHHVVVLQHGVVMQCVALKYVPRQIAVLDVRTTVHLFLRWLHSFTCSTLSHSSSIAFPPSPSIPPPLRLLIPPSFPLSLLLPFPSPLSLDIQDRCLLFVMLTVERPLLTVLVKR